VARLVFSLILLAALVALAEVAPVGVESFTIDVLAVVESLPQALINGLIGLVQLTAIVVPAVAGVMLIVRRRFVLLALCVLAASLAAVIMALLGNVIEDSIPFEELGFERAGSWFIGSQFPSSAYLAGLTAALVAASPWLAKAWRRAGWILVIAAVIARALTATEVPLRNGLLIVIGAAAGSAALLIVGAPRRRMDPETLRAALATGGLDVGVLQPVDGPQGVTSFVGLDAGEPVLVHALGRDQRDTDLLLHTWRNLTVKGLSSEPSLGTVPVSGRVGAAPAGDRRDTRRGGGHGGVVRGRQAHVPARAIRVVGRCARRPVVAGRAAAAPQARSPPAQRVQRSRARRPLLTRRSAVCGLRRDRRDPRPRRR
jgi:hypothetical protein